MTATCGVRGAGYLCKCQSPLKKKHNNGNAKSVAWAQSSNWICLGPEIMSVPTPWGQPPAGVL